MSINNKKVIAFDADDTLWINETFYKKAEQGLFKLLKDYITEEEAFDEHFRTEMQNVGLFGYGAKGFTLSMNEAALRVSGQNIEIGKRLMDYPVTILPGVIDVLATLREKYRIILVTKGDLKDQERKLTKSGLTDYFQHIEILSDKKEMNYRKLLHYLEIDPDNFLMIGNSLRSDIIPVLNIGSYAIHIPFHDDWIHESEVEEKISSNRFYEVAEISEIVRIIENNF